MSNERVQDVLSRACSFHRQLGKFYDRVSNVAQKQRVKWLLEYMSRHERQLAFLLNRVESSASKSALDTWCDDTPDTVNLRSFEGVHIHPDMELDDVLQIALHMDDCLRQLYVAMAEKTTAPDVRHIFQELMSLEKREELETVRIAFELEQS